MLLCVQTGWSQRPPSLDELEDRLQKNRQDEPQNEVRGNLNPTLTATPESSLGFGFGEPDIDAAGALVRTLNVRGPADAAGIRLGDRIVSINDARIVDEAELRKAIAQIKPGAQTTVVVLRNEKTLSFDVKPTGSEIIPLPRPNTPTKAAPGVDPPRIPPPRIPTTPPTEPTPLPADSDAGAGLDAPSILTPSPPTTVAPSNLPESTPRSAYPTPPVVPATPSFGVYPSTLTNSLRRQLDVRVYHGALIAKVVSDSIADRHGLAPGDVIVAFNGCRVDDAEDLYNAVRATRPGSLVTVLYHRRGRTYARDVTMGSSTISLRPGVAEPTIRIPSAVDQLEDRLNGGIAPQPLNSKADENAALREHVNSLQDTIDALESRIRMLEGGR